MSRGWGASGMPFSMYYMNNFARSLQYEQQLQQQQVEIERNRKKFPNKYPNAAQRTQSTKANEREKDNGQNNTYPPQLFVSHGWGPMG